MRRELAEWAQQAHDLSRRHAVGLIPVNRATLRYEHHRDPQDALPSPWGKHCSSRRRADERNDKARHAARYHCSVSVCVGLLVTPPVAVAVITGLPIFESM